MKAVKGRRSQPRAILDPEKTYTFTEAAWACGVGQQTLAAALEAGAVAELPRIKRRPGLLTEPARQIRGDELLKWLKARGINTGDAS